MVDVAPHRASGASKARPSCRFASAALLIPHVFNELYRGAEAVEGMSFHDALAVLAYRHVVALWWWQPQAAEDARVYGLGHANSACTSGVLFNINTTTCDAPMGPQDPWRADLWCQTFQTPLELITLHFLLQHVVHGIKVIIRPKVFVHSEITKPCMSDSTSKPLAQVLKPVRIHCP